jgi:hypothetical protein
MGLFGDLFLQTARVGSLLIAQYYLGILFLNAQVHAPVH